MSRPLVSVVLSVYSGEQYLEEAIDSILQQTYKNFEFIIINDGSTDSSFDIIEKYAKIDDRIIVISRENRGLIASLNEGIKKAKGKYIARMDADDISLPSRFEEQVKFMEDNKDIGVCGTWISMFKIYEKNTIWKLPMEDKDLKVRLLFSVPFAHPSVMMRKDLIDKYDLHYKNEYKDAEDYRFWLDFSKYTKFATLPTVLLDYRYLESSVTRTAERKKNEERFKVISNIFIEVLYELGVVNTAKENKLHFDLSLNMIMKRKDMNILNVEQYLNKLILANKKTKIFDENAFKSFLARKLLVVGYYQLQKYDIKVLRIIFLKLFWSAVGDVLKYRWIK